MPSQGGAPVYRDGLRAALTRWRERRQAVEARTDALSAEAWTILPEALRSELERRRALLREPDAQLDAFESAEADLETYAERIEVAHMLAAQFRAERARTAPARRRRAIRLAAGAGLVATIGAVMGAIATRYREVQKADDAAACRAALACRDDGRCTAVERDSLFDERGCIAASDADCAASRACLEQGRCVAQQRACVVSEAYCRARPECAAEGICRPDWLGWRCAATHRDDCLRSAACLDHGACTPGGVRCQVSSDEDCKGSPACKERGACQAVGGSCVDGPNAACRASTECAIWGTCSHRDGKCVALRDEDCFHSAACAREHSCKARDGRCVAATTR